MDSQISLRYVAFVFDKETQVIAGQGTFNLLAVEDLFRAVATGAPAAQFGIAFSEGSDNRTLRTTGNDQSLAARAAQLIRELNAGHFFIVLLRGAYPIQVLNNIKALSTTVNVQVASGNAINAIVADLSDISSVLGFTDGSAPGEIEGTGDRKSRRALVRRIGYLEPED
ncbi:MAG: adenosine-specific kinase [Pseudomonadota bacterium]